jgi:hypothetical protein
MRDRPQKPPFRLKREIREAAWIDGARALSPEVVRERCNFGLRQIFENKAQLSM